MSHRSLSSIFVVLGYGILRAGCRSIASREAVSEIVLLDSNHYNTHAYQYMYTHVSHTYRVHINA